jgi:tRNA (cmo5U34)-methyltransferase
VSPVIEVFAAHAADYEAPRRRLIPCFDEFYGTAADLVGQRGASVRRVLDLGAGTGLLAAAVLERHPQAQLVLLDGSVEMLAEARRHLPSTSITTLVGDLGEALPAGPFDAVVSALAIHHLTDTAKRDLLARVHDVLRPEGAFVNAEQVAGPTPWHQDVYRERWRRDCRAAGATQDEIDAAEIRMRFDRCTDVATQLDWMRAAGLNDADCFFKHTQFAVLAGWRATTDTPT